ncbi:MAG: hypothetical protein ACRDKT_09715 [Actinomycetota bacterium]
MERDLELWDWEMGEYLEEVVESRDPEFVRAAIEFSNHPTVGPLIEDDPPTADGTTP